MKLRNTIIWITNTIACIVIVLFIIVLYYMGDKPEIDKNQSIERDVNVLIRNLLETDTILDYVSVVLDETCPMVIKPDNIEGSDGLIYAPPIDGAWFSRDDFESWAKKDVINSKEAEYMFSLTDYSIVYMFDSTIIHKSVFPKKEYIELFTKNRKEAYDIIQKTS